MQDYREKVKCPYCGEMVYQVPARGEMEQFGNALLFDRILWKWQVHPHGMLPGIWDYRVQLLTAQCLRDSLPQPFRLVTVVCVKQLPGPDDNAKLHLVALKSATHERSCSFFAGQGTPAPGDLAVLCGIQPDEWLLVVSGAGTCSLRWDGPSSPACLYLPTSWLEDGP